MPAALPVTGDGVEQQMPLTPVAILSAILLATGAAGLAWWWRGRRAKRERGALNSGWQRQIDSLQTEYKRIAAQNSKLVSQLDAMKEATDQQNARARQLAGELQRAETKRDALQLEIQQIRNNLEDAVGHRHSQATETDEALPAAEADNAELVEKDRKIRRLKRELRRWQERVPPLVERYKQRDAEANEAAALYAAAQARLITLQTPDIEDGTRIEALEESSIRQLDASNDRYDDTLAVRHATPEVPKVAPRQTDNLKRIRGIGPAIEKTLNRLGIYTFRQLAALSPSEVNRVADELRGFRSRIEREDWIGQALRFQQERDNA